MEGGVVAGGAVGGGSVVGGAVVGGAVVGGAVVGGAVVGGLVVGGVGPPGSVVGGGLLVGGWSGDGTPGTGSGPDGGVVSVGVMGLRDWTRSPMPDTSGTPPGAGPWPGAGVEGPPPDPPPPWDGGRDVSGVRPPDAPATEAPKLVQPGPQGLWSLRLNTTSRPSKAATDAAQIRTRRRVDGRQLVR